MKHGKLKKGILVILSVVAMALLGGGVILPLFQNNAGVVGLLGDTGLIQVMMNGINSIFSAFSLQSIMQLVIISVGLAGLGLTALMLVIAVFVLLIHNIAAIFKDKRVRANTLFAACGFGVGFLSFSSLAIIPLLGDPAGLTFGMGGYLWMGAAAVSLLVVLLEQMFNKGPVGAKSIISLVLKIASQAALMVMILFFVNNIFIRGADIYSQPMVAKLIFDNYVSNNTTIAMGFIQIAIFVLYAVTHFQFCIYESMNNKENRNKQSIRSRKAIVNIVVISLLFNASYFLTIFLSGDSAGFALINQQYLMTLIFQGAVLVLNIVTAILDRNGKKVDMSGMSSNIGDTPSNDTEQSLVSDNAPSTGSNPFSNLNNNSNNNSDPVPPKDNDNPFKGFSGKLNGNKSNPPKNNNPFAGLNNGPKDNGDKPSFDNKDDDVPKKE